MRQAQRWLQTWQRRRHPAWQRLRHQPLSRLNDLEELAIAAEMGIRIDANQATVDDWLRLPTISIHQARLLTRLTQNGVAFHCVEDVAAALSLSPASLQTLRPVLQFYYYDPISTITPASVALNQATTAQLSILPDMSPRLIERIVNERRRSPFIDWNDAHHRLRLTADQTSQWMHYVRI
jgi:DNA uptake protein ComE-like DNA-binding protein